MLATMDTSLRRCASLNESTLFPQTSLKGGGSTYPHCMLVMGCLCQKTENMIWKNFRVVVTVVHTSGLKLLMV